MDDNTFDEIYADNVIEHLDNVIATMEELYRIAKPGALVKIIVPYFRARWAFVDPTHKHFFTTESFAYFDPDHPVSSIYPYSKARFRPEKIIFNENIPTGKGMSIIKKIANRWRWRYEKYLGHLFPLDDLSFYLIVVK